MKQKKFIFSGLILLISGTSLLLSGCDSQTSINEKSYSTDNLNISQLLENKNNLSGLEKDKEILTKINVDELIAIKSYITYLNGKEIPKELTLKNIVDDFNILNPQAPVIRGKVNSFYDYYYRDLFMMSIQGIGNAQEVGSIKNCLIYGKSQELKTITENNPDNMNSYQLGYINNSCYPENKRNYVDVGDFPSSSKVDKISTSSKEYQSQIAEANNQEDLKKGLNSLDINTDELLVATGMGKPTIGESIIAFNHKYPASPVIRGKLTENNAYVRDITLMKELGQISTTENDKINTCLTKLSNTYPYSELKKSGDINQLSLNIPIYRIKNDCSKIK